MWLHPLRPKLAFSAAISVSALSAVFAVQPVGAQDLPALVNQPSLAMPDVPTQINAIAQPEFKPEPKVDTIRFLPNTSIGLRLNGETGDLTRPVYFTAAQARSTTRFRIGYVSAISVLPTSSFIEVKINNVKIGSDSIDAASGLRIVELVFPADTLHAGYNAVSISVRQRHRVDCSVAATYELWTKIDPSATGFLLDDASHAVTDVADIPALLPRPDGSLPIHILLSGKTNPQHLQRLIKATQEIALAGHFLQPAVDFGPPSNGTFGLDLALGTRAALSQLPQLANFLDASGPLLKIVSLSSTSRPVLIVTGSTDAEVDQAIAKLAQEVPLRGSPLGLEAIARYPALTMTGATSFKLGELGAESRDFDGRLFHQSVSFQLPPDFLASDYGRGTFDLAGGYAAGLAPGSQVRVDVNGQSAGVIKLADAGGDTFKHNQLFLPLSLMTAGLNTIDVIAETPRPEDSACASSDGHRFQFLDSSRLTLPLLAHVERLPDLGEMTAGGLPYIKGNAHLVVPKPDRETMGAALSLSARAAVTAGRPIAFQFSTAVGSEDDGSTLIVSTAQQLDPSLMTAIGLDPMTVEKAWRDVVAETPPSKDQPIAGQWWKKRPDGPSACHMPLRTVADQAAASRPTSETGEILEAGLRRETEEPSLWTRIVSGADYQMHGLKNLVFDTHAPIFPPPLAQGVTANASLILAQGISPGSRDNITTIVTAPDGPSLQASMACLFDPQIWSKVRGRLATLNATNGEVVATPASSLHYIASGEPSLANSRLVLAGWFSLNPLAFAAMALFTALGLSGATLWFVRNVGRKPE